jgi:hypothetical protein
VTVKPKAASRNSFKMLHLKISELWFVSSVSFLLFSCNVVLIHVFYLPGYAFCLHNIKNKEDSGIFVVEIYVYLCFRFLFPQCFCVRKSVKWRWSYCESKCEGGGALDASATRELKPNTSTTLFRV